MPADFPFVCDNFDFELVMGHQSFKSLNNGDKAECGRAVRIAVCRQSTVWAHVKIKPGPVRRVVRGIADQSDAVAIKTEVENIPGPIVSGKDIFDPDVIHLGYVTPHLTHLFEN